MGEVMFSSEQIATETERYHRYRHSVIFPAVPISQLSGYQKVYLLSLPHSWPFLFGERVRQALILDCVDDCSEQKQDVDRVMSQLEKDVISTLQGDRFLDYYPVATVQLLNLLKVLSFHRHGLQLLLDSTACHELPIGSVQLPIFDVFADIVPCLTGNDEHEQLHDEYRFWQFVNSQIDTDELGREIVRSQIQPMAEVRRELQDCLRYLEVDQTLPSLISRPPVTKPNIDFYTELGCIRLASAEDYDKLLGLLSVDITSKER